MSNRTLTKLSAEVHGSEQLFVESPVPTRVAPRHWCVVDRSVDQRQLPSLAPERPPAQRSCVGCLCRVCRLPEPVPERDARPQHLPRANTNTANGPLAMAWWPTDCYGGINGRHEGCSSSAYHGDFGLHHSVQRCVGGCVSRWLAAATDCKFCRCIHTNHHKPV